jgi:hypothetical protein
LSQDDIGERGQNMFYVLLTDFCGRYEPFFRPRFLGDKYPTFDYIVELVDHPQYYFFVQVKATNQGFTIKEKRLKVKVSQADIGRMVRCPAPTYVVGVDEIGWTGYLLSVNEPRDHVSSLITDFRINCTSLAALADEVYDYWSSRSMVLVGSRFKE